MADCKCEQDSAELVDVNEIVYSALVTLIGPAEMTAIEERLDTLDLTMSLICDRVGKELNMVVTYHIREMCYDGTTGVGICMKFDVPEHTWDFEIAEIGKNLSKKATRVLIQEIANNCLGLYTWKFSTFIDMAAYNRTKKVNQ